MQTDNTIVVLERKDNPSKKKVFHSKWERNIGDMLIFDGTTWIVTQSGFETMTEAETAMNTK